MVTNELSNGQFQLYDLKVCVDKIDGRCTCAMNVGDSFYLKGGKLSIEDQPDFCLYALQSCIPILPAKQRMNHPADWMETDSEIACPDPACGLVMKITRIADRLLNHDDVSATNWNP